MIRPALLLPLAPLLLAATVPDPSRPTPLGRPGDWVTDMDYPATAMRNEEDGTVSFRLAIDKAGVPAGCTVTESSGVALLDETACRLLMERARFKPGRDAKGRAIGGEYNGRLTWRLPEDGAVPTFRSGIESTTFTIEADGSVTNCSSTMGGTTRDVPCSSAAPERFQPMLDAAGKPIRQRVRMTMTAELVPEKP
ncbi:MAG: energy transducer TonB [Sphingobium sp.]